MKNAVLLFDFDGTIADTFEHAIGIFNQLAAKHHFKAIDPAQIASLRNLDSRALMQQFGIPKLLLPIVILEARKLLTEQLANTEPIRGLVDVIKQLSTHNTLAIITSNSKENVELFLDQHELSELFASIHSSKHIFGKSSVIKKITKQYSDLPAVYIGDETRDIEAAKQANVTAVAVSWGFNSATILKQYQPDYLAQQPDDLLTIPMSKRS